MSEQAPAGWYTDPSGRHEHRYWDGNRWTEHVASHGRPTVDPLVRVPQTRANSGTPADWYPDPFGRHARRFWDGNRWTEHVTSRGLQGFDPPLDDVVAATAEPGIVPPNRPSEGHVASRPNKQVVRQVQRTGINGTRAGGGTLLTEPVLVVNQKAKLIGSTLSYAVYDQRGNHLGAIQEVRRDLTTRMSDRMRGRGDKNRTYRFEVVGPDGRILLAMTRPEQWFTSKSEMIVEGPDSVPIGHIAQETVGLLGAVASTLHAGISGSPEIARRKLGGVTGMAAGTALGSASRRLTSATEGLKKVGHVRFGLESDGQRLGSIHATSTNAWFFTIQDTTGAEIAAITKTWAGWTKERFTKADNYVVKVHRPLEEPLRSLVVAAALAIDVALKQGKPTTRSGSRRRFK